MPTSTAAHWDNRFDTTSAQKLTWYQPHNDISLELMKTYKPEPETSIIDVGAGNATLVDDLLANGYQDLTMLDLSRTALTQVRDRLQAKSAHVTFVNANITDWTPNRTWDIWHDRAVFHFLTDRHDQAAYLAALTQATKTGALVVIATFSTDGPTKCSGLPVQQYAPADLAHRLGPNYELLKGFQKDHITPGGGQQNFTHTVFRRK